MMSGFAGMSVAMTHAQNLQLQEFIVSIGLELVETALRVDPVEKVLDNPVERAARLPA
jgi:hypothetical protein